MKLAYVEIENSQFVRIFKSRATANASGREYIIVERSFAVGRIRHHLWLRCKGECELCAAPISEEGGHMHEQVHRGKGGEISLANSVFICPKCHQRAHADRNPRFTKKSLDI
jgi:5-methylcytosine-specific restriction endonuclease McrA